MAEEVPQPGRGRGNRGAIIGQLLQMAKAPGPSPRHRVQTPMTELPGVSGAVQGGMSQVQTLLPQMTPMAELPGVSGGLHQGERLQDQPPLPQMTPMAELPGVSGGLHQGERLQDQPPLPQMTPMAELPGLVGAIQGEMSQVQTPLLQMTLMAELPGVSGGCHLGETPHMIHNLRMRQAMHQASINKIEEHIKMLKQRLQPDQF